MYSRFTGEDYSINPDPEIADNLAARLEENGLCDATILQTHQEAGQAAGGLGENSVIDLVLGGHTHQIVNGTTDRGLRYMEPSCKGKAYAYSELAFQVEDGRPFFRRVTNASVIPTNSNTPKLTNDSANADTTKLTNDQSNANTTKLTNDPANADELDPELVKLTDDVMEILSDLYRQKIGYITESAFRYVYLPDSGDRSTTCGNWIASIYARIVDADVAFINRGGLWTDMRLEDGADRRTIYRSDIYTMFPFDNTMQCYELTWAELLEAFDYSLTEQGMTILSQVVGVNCYLHRQNRQRPCDRGRKSHLRQRRVGRGLEGQKDPGRRFGIYGGDGPGGSGDFHAQPLPCLERHQPPGQR